jgi:hypothetical protein
MFVYAPPRAKRPAVWPGACRPRRTEREHAERLDGNPQVGSPVDDPMGFPIRRLPPPEALGMPTVSIEEARRTLTEWIHGLAPDEGVVIAEYGHPVAPSAPRPPRRRRAGRRPRRQFV